MTKKYFELIATTMKGNRDDCDPAYVDQWRSDCAALASALNSTNPRFDRDRFLKACGL